LQIDFSSLKDQKNLLAFSAGVDSTALFFLLVENKISFDIAIVNYHTRESSNDEVEYAKNLANKYNKRIFIKECFIKDSNFEMRARECRHKFFEEIIKENGYKNLLLAHQLNDKLEWFLMQLSKGAGLKELLSFEKIEKKEFFTFHRPLIEISRDEIEEYLQQNEIKYFIDESNFNTKYRRNYFRKEFANKFIKEFKDGVNRSFEYLQIDKNLLFDEDWEEENGIYKFKIQNPQIDIKKIDLITKKMGYILSSNQRTDIINQNFSIVISDKIAIDKNEKFIFISPFIKVSMDKKFKEKCRMEKIPPKIRGYLYQIYDII
jgi:tRNA(Ile)-lysidine synthase